MPQRQADSAKSLSYVPSETKGQGDASRIDRENPQKKERIVEKVEACSGSSPSLIFRSFTYLHHNHSDESSKP